jgi:hypothetical protein
MRWSVGVTTCERKQSTVRRSLTSLHDAGWPIVRVFVDSDTSELSYLSKQPLVSWHHGERLGAFANWYLALTELIMREPNSHAYLLAQDDVVYAKNCRKYLESIKWPDNAGILSLFCCPGYIRGPEVGFHAENHGWGCLNALAYIFSNECAFKILANAAVVNHRRAGPEEGTKHIDRVVGRWCEEERLNYYVHCPSLCEHIGDTSTLAPHRRNAGNRVSKDFVGEQFDCMRIYQAPGSDLHRPLPSG